MGTEFRREMSNLVFRCAPHYSNVIMQLQVPATHKEPGYQVT